MNKMHNFSDGLITAFKAAAVVVAMFGIVLSVVALMILLLLAVVVIALCWVCGIKLPYEQDGRKGYIRWFTIHVND